jgi:hypothetical protein
MKVGKRYVFWRTPDGKPYKKNDQQHAPSELLAEWGKSSSINDKGEVKWGATLIIRLEVAILNTVVIIDPNGNELNSNDTKSIIRSTIVTVIKKKGSNKPILSFDFISEADRIAGKHFTKPTNKYVLVTSLSVKSLPIKRLKVGECEIISLENRDRYPLPKVLVSQSGPSRICKHLQFNKYQLIRIKTFGKSIFEAVDKALDSLNLLCGYWNLFSTIGSWSFSIGYTNYKPIGVVHAGPVHTLHHLNGTPVDNLYWYEPYFVEDHDLFCPKKWDTIEKNRRWAMRKIRHLDYRKEMENLIARYTVALDQSNLDLFFLQIWSILEKLTDTIGGKYDETIKRAIRIFPEERQVVKECLEALRFRRNQLVHAGKSVDNQDQIAYMIKSFVDPHLISLIRNDFKITSFEEYGQYLSLPVNVDVLKKQLKLLKTAVNA